MIRLFCVALLLSTACFAGERKADADESNTIRISLWNGHAPVGGDKYANEDAWITVHRPQKANGTAIVICPGGGYRAKMIGPEGHGIAAWLNRHGITGIVLDYRLPAGRAFVPLLERAASSANCAGGQKSGISSRRELASWAFRLAATSLHC